MKKETELYRYFDKEGDLLYIGISLNSVARQAQHKMASFWYKEAVRVEIERHGSREDALLAERTAIKEEGPKHNIQHNGFDKAEDYESQEYFEEQENIDRVLLLGRSVVYKPIYTEKEVGDVIFGEGSNSAKRVKSLIESQKIQAILIKEWEQKDRFGQNGIRRKYMVTGWALIDFIEALEQGETSL